jgi:hypothetical protein
MTPRESDPNGANSGGGAARLENDAGPADEAHERSEVESAHPSSQAESITPGVDEAERQTITSGIAQTSEVADRDAQDDAEGRGQGTPQHR